MASLNQAQLIGNLGRDPELRTFPSGDRVTNISIATTERWKDKESGEMKEATEWHRVVFHNRLAEIADEYLVKGSQVFVQGRIKTKKWTDKDGVERYTTEIHASEMKMLGSREGGDGGHRESPERQERRANESYGQQPERSPGQRARTAAPAQNNDTRRQQAARPSSGFDDMDDDIPF